MTRNTYNDHLFPFRKYWGENNYVVNGTALLLWTQMKI